MGAFQNLRVYCATALAGQVFILTLGLYLIDKLFFVPKLLDHHKFFPLDKFDIFQAILDKEEIFLKKKNHHHPFELVSRTYQEE